MTDILITILAEFLYFQSYQMLIFPEVWKFLKHANLKIMQVFNSKIT